MVYMPKNRVKWFDRVKTLKMRREKVPGRSMTKKKDNLTAICEPIDGPPSPAEGIALPVITTTETTVRW
jgi:hypothetical protein